MGDISQHWRYVDIASIPEAYAALRLELRDPGMRKLRIWQLGLQKESARLARLFPDPSDFSIAVSSLTRDVVMLGRESAFRWWKMDSDDDRAVKHAFLLEIIAETVYTTAGGRAPLERLYYMQTEALEAMLRQVKAERARAQAGLPPVVKQQHAGAAGALVSWVISAGTRTTSPFYSTPITHRSMKLHAE